MESQNPLLIAVDAGHGGFDNGASWQGRLEKDDNLRLALQVQKELLAQGIRVLMTRDQGVFVTLQDRARMANQAGADLFISLHRNSYTEPTPSTQGVENFIYLTAPQQTAGRAAELVLQQVVDVGVQSNRGVKRGNYYVLRRTNMPAMLLEMGYIINEIDNQLFDENLEAYAAAIARGAMQYFGLTYNPALSPMAPAPPPLPPSPVGPVPTQPSGTPQSEKAAAQKALNDRFGTGIPLSGVWDTATKRAAITAMQRTLNASTRAGLTVDGLLGPQTREALPTVREGQRNDYVLILQALLALRGYNPGAIDGMFGPRTRVAVQTYQRDHYLTPDGIAGPAVFGSLLR